MDGFCTQNRRFHPSGRITKKQEGLVLQIVTWGVLVHGYKNTEGPCITDCNMGGSCTWVQEYRTGLVLRFVTRIVLNHGVQENRERFVTRTNPDWSW